MAAYVLANVEVLDAAGFAPYREAVPATIAKYGGRYLARGGATTSVEGGAAPKRVVLLEFPDAATARAWLDSPEYEPLIEIRQRTAKTDIWLIDGVSP
jgi:uncharacterized protein (DUF1330 family)